MHPLLTELQHQLDALPEGELKHDLEPGFEAMAAWVSELDPLTLASLLDALPSWLDDATPWWHRSAVLELAWRLGEPGPLKAALARPEANEPRAFDGDGPYPAWLDYRLGLLSAISHWTAPPPPDAVAFLRDQRSRLSLSDAYSVRMLGTRAWLTETLFQPTAERHESLTSVVELLRSWKDARLWRSSLGLLHVYFASDEPGRAQVDAVLTSEERSEMLALVGLAS